MNVAAPAAQNAKWTILLYSAADNNLLPYMVDDVKEIEAVGSDSYTNLVAQVDQGESLGAARYLLEKATDPKPGEISSPKLEDMGSIDMANPQTLADFVKWGVQKYPAEHYMLIISDHGGGWPGACSDDSHGSWMTSPMIRGALEQAQTETGKKIDVLGMDACLMASTEYAHEVKDVANYLVASEQNEGAEGWSYTQLLTPDLIKAMRQSHMMKINIEPRQLAQLGVSTAQASQEVLPTMSAVDTSKMPALTAAVDSLGKAIIASETPASVISDIGYQAVSFGGFKDLGDFANGLAQSEQIADENLKAAAQHVNCALNEAVIAEQHSDRYAGATGLHIEIPSWGGVPDGYGDLKFAQDSSWPQALAKITSSEKN